MLEAGMHKVKMDIELLLRWAYVDELSKRQCYTATSTRGVAKSRNAAPAGAEHA
jgi:hypothetical protein